MAKSPKKGLALFYMNIASAARRLSSITLSKQLHTLIYTRAMSEATRTHHQFMVYAPDYTDEGALQRRLNVRERHMAAAKGLHGLGSINIGGAVLSPDGLEVSEPTSKMIGSMLVLRAESLAEARKQIEADIYWTAGVWDKERLLILPFLQAPFTELPH